MGCVYVNLFVLHLFVLIFIEIDLFIIIMYQLIVFLS